MEERAVTEGNMEDVKGKGPERGTVWAQAASVSRAQAEELDWERHEGGSSACTRRGGACG